MVDWNWKDVGGNEAVVVAIAVLTPNRNESMVMTTLTKSDSAIAQVEKGSEVEGCGSRERGASLLLIATAAIVMLTSREWTGCAGTCLHQME